MPTAPTQPPKIAKSNSLALSAWLDNESQAFLFGWNIQPSGRSFHERTVPKALLNVIIVKGAH
jgi:hypothetical protein